MVETVGTKICKKCGEEKDINLFRIRRGNKDGRAGDCNNCRNKLRREDRPRKDAIASQQRQNRTEDPKYFRNYELRRRHQITLEEFEEMFDKQGRVCAACGSSESGETPPRTWNIDHDHACCPGRKHTCGQCIRGILCRWCNTALGCARDDQKRLLGLVDYLNRYNSRTLVSC